MAYEALGNYKKALTDWQEVKKIGGQNVENADVLIERVDKKMKEKK